MKTTQPEAIFHNRLRTNAKRETKDAILCLKSLEQNFLIFKSIPFSKALDPSLSLRTDTEDTGPFVLLKMTLLLHYPLTKHPFIHGFHFLQITAAVQNNIAPSFQTFFRYFAKMTKFIFFFNILMQGLHTNIISN